MNITEKSILNEAFDHKTYMRGRQYYLGGNIFKIDFDPEKLIAHAKVSGRRDYDVDIEFDNKGSIIDSYCDCPAFESFGGGCKHIVAVLKKVQEILPQYKKDIKKPLRDDFFDIFDYVSKVEKQEINLEITLGIEQGYGNSMENYLELRIGKDYLYSARNIKDLLNSMETGEIIDYGKKFSYDPSKHRFSKLGENILSIIKELYEIENLSKNYASYYINSSIFKGKKVYIPSSIMKRILDLFDDEMFFIKILDNKFEVRGIEKDTIPIEFDLKSEDKYLSLKWKEKHRFLLLEESGTYFLYGKQVYRMNEEQKRYMSLFYNSFKNKDIVYLQEEQKERFVSEVLPAAHQIGEINVDEKVEDSLYKVDLEPEIYLDQGSEGIKTEIVFIYGDAKINPFSEEQTKRVKDKILVRDIEKENKILSYFEDMEFKVSKNYLYLDGEDLFFEFIYEVIPKLQELAQVYYSESFKNMTIKDPSLFSVGIRLNEESDMLEFSFEHEDIPRDEIWDILSSLKEKKKYYKLKNGGLLPLESNVLDSISHLVDYLNIDKKDLSKEVIQLPKYRALYLDEEIKESDFYNTKRNQSFKRLVQNIKEPGDLDLTIPKEMEGILRDYQKVGYKWLKTLSAYGFGGILADDMGLGKTLQTLTFIMSEREGDPSLIVAPTSLVYNWKDEAEKFIPELKVIPISGNKDERLELLEEAKNADIIVTSYALIRRDIDLYKEIHFKYCFLDEAQHIKNPLSLNARSVKTINASGFFALTGTPIENSLTELWSIFDFVLPGYLLSHRKFVDKYERPIVKNADEKALAQLQKQIRPFILRRMKKDVLKELPEKIESKMTAELTEEQKKIYFAYVEKAKGEIAKEIAEKGYDKSHIKILSVLTRLRQICCHPASFLEDYMGDSGKIILLEEIIEELIEGGHRALLFSQFTSMLQIIGTMLKRKKIDYFYLDGSTPAQDRGEIVKRFNKGEKSFFLISLKAGGTGLNLTGADTVIHFDPWWNPAVEDQAADRAYRIGQKNSVQVLKLITKGTIEEKIYKLQMKKREMIDAVIHPGESIMSKMTEEEIRELFD